MTSTTLTIRVDESDKARLDALARSTGRSRSFLAAEAIAEYLSVNEWQIEAIRTAIAETRAGRDDFTRSGSPMGRFVGHRPGA